MSVTIHTIPVHDGYTPESAWEAIVEASLDDNYDGRADLFPDDEPEGWANIIVTREDGEEVWRVDTGKDE